MKYNSIIQGRFISRPNRFIAEVETDVGVVTAHVKNTGRCRELLTEGARVYLAVSDNPERRTAYDLVAVEKPVEWQTEPLLINMDSQLPNAMAREWIEQGGLFDGETKVFPERRYGSSRIDLYCEKGERRIFVEVKGVTLEEDRVAMFPDAPTERGVKHLYELIAARREGFEASILFVVQMQGIISFRPHTERDPRFAKALKDAADAGVGVLCYDSAVTPDGAVIASPVEVII